jgi:hypothetical protein
MKYLYGQNYKTLKDESGDENEWKNTSCLWIKSINIVKMSIVCKKIDSFTMIPIKTPISLFTEIEKRRKIKRMNKFGLLYIHIYIYIHTHTWRCHNEIPCIASVNKQKYRCFFTKAENKKAKWVLSGDLIPVGGSKL